MNFVPYLVLWALLALTLLALFIWRKIAAVKEDDNLHVIGAASAAKTAEQAGLAHKLDFIDRWGKIITLVTVAYGLVLGALYAWQGWVDSGRIGG